jgi:hypothetical protein
MKTKLEDILRTQGREWKWVARGFADATKDSQNDTLVYLRARVRFLEEEDKKLASDLRKEAQP